MTDTFRDGEIQGVIIRQLSKFIDERGWLAEFFRKDELQDGFFPAMGYISVTLPNVTRGPHEHESQTDLFCFLGPGEFKVTLWDNRKECQTFGNRMELFFGGSNPMSIIVPPGVVHGYRCISQEPGWVVNCPDQLYKGQGRALPVDEIRHEVDPKNPFVMDEIKRRTVTK